MIDLMATAILVLWIGLGINLTRMTWDRGYSPIWVGVTGLMTAALSIPLSAIWS
jgi:hypothetical protein